MRLLGFWKIIKEGSQKFFFRQRIYSGSQLDKTQIILTSNKGYHSVSKRTAKRRFWLVELNQCVSSQIKYPTWIKKYLDKENRGKWKLFFGLELEKSGGAIVLTSNLNAKDTNKTLKINNQFRSEVLTIWAEVNFEEEITSESQFLDQSPWHNSLIRINHPIFYREWFQKGVLQLKHFKDGSNYFLSFTDLQNKYSLNACPLGYCGLLSALKRLWNTVKNMKAF